MSAVADKVKKIVVENLAVSEDQVTPEEPIPDAN